MSTPRHRSYNGCWTCKRVRRKCDRARPACKACSSRGVPCEGYEIRLRWGSGIASRGRFTGAEEPVEASIPPRVKGRRRDLSRERRRKPAKVANGKAKANSSHLEPVAEQTADVRLNEQDRLFQEFCSSGINVLHSTSVNDARNLLQSRLPILSQQSSSLYAICVALQASLTPNVQPRFYEHFDVALNLFRTELSSNVTYLKDGTFTAGLLLCSIGLMHAMPWTMHLHGMYGLLQAHGLYGPGERTEFRTHLLEVMGVMDLPTFTVGRSTSLGFWRQHCRDGTSLQHPLSDEVEVVSGLPRSLLDIISCIGHGATEEDFWNWPGSPGSLSQHQLWEAYRLAGLLAIRYNHLLLVPQPNGTLTGSTVQPNGASSLTLPSTTVLVSRIVSHLDAIRRAFTETEGAGSLIFNAIKYPAFIAGLQTDIINAQPELKDVLRCCLSTYGHPHGFERDFELLLEVLEEWWVHHHDMANAHELALARGMEIGLL
ncbi:C6 finger domain protein [Aspergillus nomiae NRRL 13137]|uniref:C6 finger domain protein n=1 Tax=Aspergillus nomiae NRRL (strain ATCC 15546 / NRRL 13137 / CBS 260.88 / M93) TaxID=1509407 RepID=A0A0L1J394_ASPN3|nr:C6 finger domain protein [Aspergillus nomiae NRRL 13137]KNG86207.1 C6 finger domain protein [Aspergillus nomiae NRRL 13137]